MIYKLMGAAVAATLVFAAAPVAHAAQKLPTIGSVEKRDVVERNQIRKKQVQQNTRKPMFEPIFAPFYKGKDAPLNGSSRSY
ncbi:MAG TPA: hypothetical protein VLA00_07180 [Xanthobacteraceae bacterium]|nr:hypothetical protein [Xanthobacteraceae bacterium]